MKRFAAIITIAVVVLALSVGPAFASVCPDSACGSAIVCSMSLTPSCPMQTGAPMVHAACGQSMDRGSRELVANPGTPGSGLVATPLAGATVQPPALLSVATAPLADARGAPHLTSVIRI